LHEPEIATLVADNKRYHKQIEEIYKSIVGNGQPGLKVKVASLEQQQRDAPSPRSMIFYASIGGAMVTFSCGAVIITGKLIFNAITGG